jgi:hypothetical protein
VAWPIYGEEGLDTRTLTLRDLAGVEPLPAEGGDFVFMPDTEGLDMPPREVIRQPLPGLDGAQLREIRTLEREVFLPIWLASSTSHQHYLERRDALADLFQYRYVDYKAEAGTLDLVATSTRGERTLRCVYLGGMTSAMRPNEGPYWAKLGVTLLAVQPYWVGGNWQTATLQLGAEPDPFAGFELQLSSSVVLGSGIAISIGGDVPSWPVIQVTGPATTVTVEGPGLLVSIPDGLGSGETARIVTDPRNRTATFDGDKDWSRVGPLTTWAPLNPGNITLDVLLTGATSSTSATISGSTLYERPW